VADASSLKTEDSTGNLRGVLPAGTSLRGYELKSILGQGAFGITYRARDLNLGRDVAIKEYLPTALALREGRTTVLPRSPDHAEQFAWGRERFLEEARTLARLDRTPAIVRVHDFLEDNGTAYMVMALIEGETLAKRLQREVRLTAEAVERILFPLLDGLEEVHGIGFLHRDIKPANIMVDRAGRATLIDFGASRAAMTERSTTMTAIFSPGYAAAEQFTSSKLGPWTDIYGLAATMCHAITGAIPPSAIDRILKDTYVPLSDLAPEGFAPELLAGIDAGLAIRSEERPHNIAQWRHALRSGERPVQSIETTQIERRPRRGRRGGIALRGPSLWGAAAAAGLLLIGTGWLVYRTQGPPTAETTALALSTEQLEQVLAERRKADALAADKRRLEDEARQKAEAEAETKRQAEEDLQRAREARQKAEEELERLKARIAAQSAAVAPQRDQQAADEQQAREAEAQRQAEAQTAALRTAEEEAQRKAEADAEAKRRADEVLTAAEAERRRADQEARAKVEAEQQALQKASEEAQRRAADAERQKAEAEAKTKADAEAAERALKLEPADRQRLQVALTSLGFDTRGNDGLFGPRSRETIAGWQKARNIVVTGYLNADQQQRLLKEAAPALAKLDEKQKADEKAKLRTASVAAVAPPVASPGGASAGTSFDGSYSGILQGGSYGSAKISLQISQGAGTISLNPPGCEPIHFRISVSGEGAVAGRTYFNCSFGSNATGSQLRAGDFDIDGRVRGDSVDIWFRSSANSFRVSFYRETSAVTRYDGTYKGDANLGGQGGSASRVFADFVVRNGSGSGTLSSPGCTPSPVVFTISPTGDISGHSAIACVLGAFMNAGRLGITGRADGRALSLELSTERGNTFRLVLAQGG
jgi:hypothetical protein